MSGQCELCAYPLSRVPFGTTICCWNPRCGGYGLACGGVIAATPETADPRPATSDYSGVRAALLDELADVMIENRRLTARVDDLLRANNALVEENRELRRKVPAPQDVVIRVDAAAALGCVHDAAERLQQVVQRLRADPRFRLAAKESVS